MTVFVYLAGFIGIITMGAGIAALYIEAPQTTIRIDIKHPGLLLKVIGLLLIAGGALNLIGNVYLGFQWWDENRNDTTIYQNEFQGSLPTSPSGLFKG